MLIGANYVWGILLYSVKARETLYGILLVPREPSCWFVLLVFEGVLQMDLTLLCNICVLCSANVDWRDAGCSADVWSNRPIGVCASPGQQGEEITSLSSPVGENLVSRDITEPGAVWPQDLTENQSGRLQKHHGLIWCPILEMHVKFSHPSHWDTPYLLLAGLPKAQQKEGPAHWWPSAMESLSITQHIMLTWKSHLSINFRWSCKMTHWPKINLSLGFSKITHVCTASPF